MIMRRKSVRIVFKNLGFQRNLRIIIFYLDQNQDNKGIDKDAKIEPENKVDNQLSTSNIIVKETVEIGNVIF